MADVFVDFSDRLPALPFTFRQFLSGPHENFHYILADPATGEAAVVDPSFHLDDLFHQAEAAELHVRDAFFTHGHWDHIGGVPDIIARGVDRIYIHEDGKGHPKVAAALDAGAEVGLASDGDVVMVGDVPVRILHTPGHQPEAVCYLVGPDDGPQVLLGGDTLFIDSCGRTDFPGGDTDAMFTSMHRLRGLASPHVHLMPGHHYAAHAHRPMNQQMQANPALATTSREEFGELAFLRG